MNNSERLESYATQVAARAARGGDFTADVSEDNPLLTPGMKRRLRKRKHSPKAHSHRQLPLIPDSGPGGRWRRVPCSLCRPHPLALPFIGG